MTRNQFFVALFTAPFAVFATANAKSVAESEIVVKITCDASEVQAAIARYSEHMERRAFTPDEVCRIYRMDPGSLRFDQ